MVFQTVVVEDSSAFHGSIAFKEEEHWFAQQKDGWRPSSRPASQPPPSMPPPSIGDPVADYWFR